MDNSLLAVRDINHKYIVVESMRDYFSEEDLVKIQNAEMLVSALVGYGWGYNEIKEFILNKGINKIAA